MNDFYDYNEHLNQRIKDVNWIPMVHFYIYPTHGVKELNRISSLIVDQISFLL